MQMNKHMPSQSCCSHELLLKGMTRVNEHRKMEEKQLQGEVRFMGPLCFFKGNIYPLAKKGREGKSSS